MRPSLILLVLVKPCTVGVLSFWKLHCIATYGNSQLPTPCNWPQLFAPFQDRIAHSSTLLSVEDSCCSPLLEFLNSEIKNTNTVSIPGHPEAVFGNATNVAPSDWPRLWQTGSRHQVLLAVAWSCRAPPHWRQWSSNRATHHCTGRLTIGYWDMPI